MKAIETVYKGYRFRSRLEARWAVFFDAAGIPYEYEPEGYELPNGLYLPDFYLPWFRCYVEIKPNEATAIEKGDKCCRILRDNLEDGITALCIGEPADNKMRLYCYTSDDSGGGSYEYDRAFFIKGASWRYWINGFVDFEVSNTSQWISIMVDEPRKDRSIHTQSGKWCSVESIWLSEDWNYPDVYLITDCRSDFTYSKYKARRARFEYGESPLEDKYELPESLPFEKDFWNFVKNASKNVSSRDLVRYHKITDGKYDIEEAGLGDIWG